MANTVLIACVDEMLIYLLKVIHKSSEKLLGLQLDPAAEPKALHLQTRACAIHAGNLRNLTQLRKLLTSPNAAASPAEDSFHELLAMMDVGQPSASANPSDYPAPAPSVPDHAPALPARPPSAPPVQSQPPAPTLPTSPPAPAPSAQSPSPPAPASATPPRGPSANPPADSGALFHRAPNVPKPAHAPAAQFPPPPRPPAGWYPG